MDYNEAINSAKTVLVEFYASWCPHCQRMMPVVEEVKTKLAGKAKVYQYDVDKYPELTSAEGVSSYPTFIIYSEGAEVWRESGEMPGSQLLKAVEQYI